jgi:hypothetical protein
MGGVHAPPITRFQNLHKGETCLLVGNGKNLYKTPPERFDYPSFGMNTICQYPDWKPTYYTAVDSRVMHEYGEQVNKRFSDIPKFLPTPNLDKWTGENIYRFYHRPGALWARNGKQLFPSLMTDDGINYGNVMHVAMQLAYYMGFTTMLIIGMEHEEGKAGDHFWGADHKSYIPPVDEWKRGYKELREGMGVKMLNISVDTFVPEDVVPKGDWERYVSL